MNSFSRHTISILMALLVLVPVGRATASGRIPSGQHLTWQQAVKKAQAENKLLFVEFCQTSHEKCSAIDTKLLTDPAIVDYVNRYFIFFKAQMDMGASSSGVSQPRRAGKEDLANKFNVKDVPTFLFLSSAGELIIRDNKPGDDVASLMWSLKMATGETEHYSAWKAKYLAGEKDFAVATKMIGIANVRHEKAFANQVADEAVVWLMNKPEELYSKTNVKFVGGMLRSTKSPGFALFFPDSSKVDEIIGDGGDYSKGVVDGLIYREELKPYEDAVKPGEDIPWDKIQHVIVAKYNEEVAERFIVNNKVSFYVNHQMWPEAVPSILNMVERFGDVATIQSFGMYNINVLTAIFVKHCDDKLCDDKDTLNRAMKWGEDYLNTWKPEDRWYHYDELGVLMYKAGHQDQGIHYLQVNIQRLEVNAAAPGGGGLQALHDGKEYKNKMAVLARMKEGQKFDTTWDLSGIEDL